jgi:hypothetical protein
MLCYLYIFVNGSTNVIQNTSFEHSHFVALFYFTFVFLISRVNEYICVSFVGNSEEVRCYSIVNTLFYGDGILLVFLMNFIIVPSQLLIASVFWDPTQSEGIFNCHYIHVLGMRYMVNLYHYILSIWQDAHCFCTHLQVHFKICFEMRKNIEQKIIWQFIFCPELKGWRKSYQNRVYAEVMATKHIRWSSRTGLSIWNIHF